MPPQPVNHKDCSPQPGTCICSYIYSCFALGGLCEPEGPWFLQWLIEPIHKACRIHYSWIEYWQKLHIKNAWEYKSFGLLKKIYIDVSSWTSLIWKSPVKSVLVLKSFECHADASKALGFRATCILYFWTKDAQPEAYYIVSENPAWGCSLSLSTISSSHFCDLGIRKQKSSPPPKASRAAGLLIAPKKPSCSDEAFIFGHNKKLERGNNEGGYLKWRNI